MSLPFSEKTDKPHLVLRKDLITKNWNETEKPSCISHIKIKSIKQGAKTLGFVESTV